MTRIFLVLWALVAAAWCWHHDPARRPITGDNQLYFYLAERAASGVAPHVSLLDTKSQLGQLVTGGAIAAGRLASIDDVLASRAASIAFATAAVVLAGAVATSLTGSLAAGHVAAFAMLAARGFAEHAATGSNPKVFLAAFLLLAHFALARRRAVAAGAAAGAAFLCWQPALAVVAALVLEAWTRGGARRAMAVLAGAALPVAGYELYFAMHGALVEQLAQEYAMTLGSVHASVRPFASLWFVLTEARGAASPLRVAPLAAVLLVGVSVARWIEAPSRMREAMSRPGVLAFVAGGAAATLFTLYDHQGVPDLFFVAPYFAVATGALAARATAVTRFAPAAFAALLALQLARDETLRARPSYDLDDQRRVASEVAALRARTGEVWVYQAVHLLGLARLDNHVPYALSYDDVESVLATAAYRPLREGRLPAVVIHGRDPIPGAADWLSEGFEDRTSPDFKAQGLRLWVRRTAAP